MCGGGGYRGLYVSPQSVVPLCPTKNQLASSMTSDSPPSWWLLGPSCWSSIRDEPAGSADALAQLLAPSSALPAGAMQPQTVVATAPAPPPDSMTLRQRLEPPKFDVREHSLRSERRRGLALCRREDVERKMMDDHMAEMRARQRVLAEAQAAAAAAKSAELTTPVAEPESGKRKMKEESAAAQSKRKPAPPLARVEVALNEEDMASWYEANVLQETKTRSKVKLLVLPQARGGSGNDGEDEDLLIEGRKGEESVSKDGVRPVPPIDPTWTPAIGENCELLYLDGWWPVKVKKVEREKNELKYHVFYEAYGVQHTVSRAQLRQIVYWNPETSTFNKPSTQRQDARRGEAPGVALQPRARQRLQGGDEAGPQAEDQA